MLPIQAAAVRRNWTSGYSRYDAGAVPMAAHPFKHSNDDVKQDFGDCQSPYVSCPCGTSGLSACCSSNTLCRLDVTGAHQTCRCICPPKP
jgi:hypothetical protein